MHFVMNELEDIINDDALYRYIFLKGKLWVCIELYD